MCLCVEYSLVSGWFVGNIAVINLHNQHETIADLDSVVLPLQPSHFSCEANLFSQFRWCGKLTPIFGSTFSTRHIRVGGELILMFNSLSNSPFIIILCDAKSINKALLRKWIDWIGNRISACKIFHCEFSSTHVCERGNNGNRYQCVFV